MGLVSHRALTWGGVGVLLQYPYTIPPVIPVEARAQAIPHVRGPGVAVEGAGSLLSRPRESHILFVCSVYCHHYFN